MMNQMIFLTGRPGCGKTTLIRCLLEEYPGDVGGFYTQEIREGGRRKGFEIITMDGQRGILAHVDIQSAQRVGKYKLDLLTLERLAVPAIQEAVDREAMVVIDEIGPMEIRSKKFRQTVIQTIQRNAKVLGTIVQRSMPFTDRIKRMPGVQLIEIKIENRLEMQTRIHNMLSGE
jgi:nucleoside-triphosphatase